MQRAALLSFVLAAVASMAAHALDASQVPEKKRTRLGLYLGAAEAYELAQREKLVFIDIRTRAEVNFLGMPTIADANIPYMALDAFWAWDEAKGNFKLEPNGDFVPAVGRLLERMGQDRKARIVLMCRSGDRSARAADLLAQSGFANVWTVIDGYEGDVAKDGPHAGQRVVNGWKNAQLPWTYKLTKAKMYQAP